MTEQRKYSRYAIALDAVVDVGGVPVTGRTCDISKGGFCLLSAQAVPMHVPCSIKLALVFSETEFSEYLLLSGVTVWCTRLKSGYQLGVKFTDLSPANKDFLDLFMRFLEGDEDEAENQAE